VDLELGVVDGTCVFFEYADLAADAADGCLGITVDTVASGTSVLNQVDTLAELPAWTMLPNEYEESDSATCEVAGEGPTRTRGFWQTHGSDGENPKLVAPDYDPFGYTCHVFYDTTNGLGGVLDLGWVVFDDSAGEGAGCRELLGGFWAKNARDSQDERRDKACQAVVTSGKQAIAAALNEAAFGTPFLAADPYSDAYLGLNILEAWKQAADTATTTNGKQQREAIKALRYYGGWLDMYNNSGDGYAIVDDIGVGPADPTGVRAVYDLSSVDCN
jgi:hypothetical protein